MKNIITFLLLIGLMVSCSTKDIPQNNKLTKQEIKEGWELLFDGKTTDGWRNFGQAEIQGWKVIDGVLHNSGKGSDHGGDIVSDSQYEDFELYMEWKIDKESNSGVFYRVDEQAVDAIYKTGPEYQLLDDIGWPDKLDASQYTAANYGMNNPIDAKVKPITEFNITRIIIKDSLVEHWLNGQKVVEYKLWDKEWFTNKENCKWKDHPHYGIAKKGSIGLQDHGGLTMFRNIKIRRL